MRFRIRSMIATDAWAIGPWHHDSPHTSCNAAGPLDPTSRGYVTVAFSKRAIASTRLWPVRTSMQRTDSIESAERERGGGKSSRVL